jgi:hypothetical protein
MHAIRIERIAQRAHDMFLTHQFNEPLRPPFARENLI